MLHALEMEEVCMINQAVTFSSNGITLKIMVDSKEVGFKLVADEGDLRINLEGHNLPLFLSNGELIGTDKTGCFKNRLKGLFFCDPLDYTEWRFDELKIVEKSNTGNFNSFDFKLDGIKVIVDNSHRSVNFGWHDKEWRVSGMLPGSCEKVRKSVEALSSVRMCVDKVTPFKIDSLKWLVDDDGKKTDISNVQILGRDIILFKEGYYLGKILGVLRMNKYGEIEPGHYLRSPCRFIPGTPICNIGAWEETEYKLGINMSRTYYGTCDSFSRSVINKSFCLNGKTMTYKTSKFSNTPLPHDDQGNICEPWITQILYDDNDKPTIHFICDAQISGSHITLSNGKFAGAASNGPYR